MTQASCSLSPPITLDYENTLVLAIELSKTKWVLSAQVPGLLRVKAKQTIEPKAEALLAAIDGYRDRSRAAGRTIERVVAIYEASWSGFWLARWLGRHGVETHVVQPSSVPVDRRARRAKSDGIDAELLLRTLLAWLRGEPRVCSMVPIPDEADEDERRRVREREDLMAERVSLVNRIGAVLATLGVGDYNPLRRDRRARLESLRTALGDPLPPHARAKNTSHARPPGSGVCANHRTGAGARRGTRERGSRQGGKDDPATRRTTGDWSAERHRACKRSVRARIRQRQGTRLLRRAHPDAVQ